MIKVENRDPNDGLAAIFYNGKFYILQIASFRLSQVTDHATPMSGTNTVNNLFIHSPTREYIQIQGMVSDTVNQQVLVKAVIERLTNDK